MLLLLACTEPEAPKDSAQPVPYIYASDDDAEPTLGTSDVEALLASALERVWTISAEPVFPAYHAAMAGSDAGCPNYYEYDGNAYWYDECESDAGTTFSGYAFDYVYADYAYEDYVLNGEALYGVGTATDATGATLSFGGSATFYTATPTVPVEDPNWYIAAYNQVQGGFSYDGATAAGTWLEDGEAPDLYTSTYYVPSYDGRYAYVDGAVMVDGTPVVFDTLYLYSANLMPDCPDEPYGGASVRDAAGDWYDVVFDGPAEYGDPVDAALCDGCGEVYFHGRSLGTVCAAFETLTDWEETPW